MSSSYAGDKSSRKGNDVCEVRLPLSGAFIPPTVSEIILICPVSLKRRLQLKGLTIGLLGKWQRGERSPRDMFLPHPYRVEELAGWSRKPGGPKAGAAVPP